MLLAAASGFTQYGYVYVEQSADEAASDNFEHARALRKRARRLYLRGYHYGLRGLEGPCFIGRLPRLSWRFPAPKMIPKCSHKYLSSWLSLAA